LGAAQVVQKHMLRDWLDDPEPPEQLPDKPASYSHNKTEVLHNLATREEHTQTQIE
jgi:hypothetical protein